jgi:hypothetical protein
MSVTVFGTHFSSSLPAGATRLRLGRVVMKVSHLGGALGALVPLMLAISSSGRFPRDRVQNGCRQSNRSPRIVGHAPLLFRTQGTTLRRRPDATITLTRCRAIARPCDRLQYFGTNVENEKLPLRHHLDCQRDPLRATGAERDHAAAQTVTTHGMHQLV